MFILRGESAERERNDSQCQMDFLVVRTKNAPIPAMIAESKPERRADQRAKRHSRRAKGAGGEKERKRGKKKGGA
jgi:hypothetical protein